VIQIESVEIKELRGIRDLTLEMNRESFVISGPNGSGKSGVVDAIQFALTGEIGRLKGAGTGNLTLSEHGPHVEARSDPDAASVRLSVYIPHLKKKASIVRTIKHPKKPTITPDDASVRAVFDEVARHPEISLSRREIIKFILTEATQRSRDVQTLLKLDDIDQTRATLKTTENKLDGDYSTAKIQSGASEDSLKRHLDLPTLKVEDLLQVVNKRRSLLRLERLTQLTKETDLSQGISGGASQDGTPQSKESALADVKALLDAVSDGIETELEASVSLLLQNIGRLEENPSLLATIKRHHFLQSGLDLLDGPNCPLCDAPWDMDALRIHLRGKLEQSKEAQLIRDQLLRTGREVTNSIIRLLNLTASATKVIEVPKELTSALGQWSGDLQAFSESVNSVEGIVSGKARFESGWSKTPSKLIAELQIVEQKVKARPDKSATVEANSFLVVAQERLRNLRLARRSAEEKRGIAALGKTAYKTYCDVSEAALLSLYEEVETEFGSFYRSINQDDEGEFRAKFEASNGKLGLLVDFHKKGMFPPGAYHSEGHQDGMGVCLYLALMKRVLSNNFTLAVLDDVVMSVDSQHRKQFCKLLKLSFPHTQFVITTHDQVWARQLRSEGVVGPKSAVAFHTWTVETGPILDEIAEVWDKIDVDLAKNEVPTAAARLRRHLEFVASDLADELGAKVHYRADGGYDMGELLSAVIGRQGELLKQAAKAAKSWGDSEEIAKVAAFQDARNRMLAERDGEQWIINKAIHYNEWADLSKNDFKPVVVAFRQLLQQFSSPWRKWLNSRFADIVVLRERRGEKRTGVVRESTAPLGDSGR
jgi:energy-coupling factor transporter ATP-binding protein EcfA2